MKKVMCSVFMIATLSLMTSQFNTKIVSAGDIYVPFGKKDLSKEESGQIIDFEDLNLKESLLEYYKFHIDKNYKGKDITVGMMKQFTSLSLPWMNIFSLKGLEYATNLKTLNLSNNFIEDLSPLENLKEIEDLNLTNNKIKDTKSLAQLKKLKQLSLRKNLMNNLDFLNELNVESLDISINGALKDYVPNNLKLDNIRSLNISGIGFDNITFLKNAKKLESLIAEENSIKDLTPLESLNNIRILYLDRNNIIDISPLRKLENLEELLLYKNSIEDIRALYGKKYLYRLMLNDNLGLKDISPLATAGNLASLDISNTAVEEIKPLNDLKYIYYVAVKNTKISNNDLEKFEEHNKVVKKNNNIDKKIEVIKTEASKYFSIKNYIFMFIIVLITLTGIRSYWRKNK
ncbi:MULTISPECIES: leucine-rich repeat domain-containing protein [Gemella]|uniref:leucine-rich repeat domain-containing protein n=1 Tax=Gemella TaxID=1378 RepID=UPI0007684918|nr:MULTISPECIES: leucine-rich repeat domain-containing protein [Gemella]AME09063.1 internalin [Gemella sp. oral taxon 928]AXI26635.1 leucine-rich repeat domain-containing protein [Gemella sp. ND 6198]